jgi:multidrug efflux pump subunit AcrA (membrane-fusion protein)
VIAQIDPSTYEQNITQSEADLASAQAALEYAEMNHRRAKELRANDLVSPPTLTRPSLISTRPKPFSKCVTRR